MAGVGHRERIIDRDAFRSDLRILSRRFSADTADVRAALLARFLDRVLNQRIDLG